MGRGWCGRSARSKASTQIALIGRVRFRRLRGLLLTQRSFRAVQRWSVGFFAQTGESESCDAPDICQSKMASGDSGDQMSETRKVAVGYARGIIGGMLIGVPQGDLTLRDVAGKLLLQCVPVSIGSSVAMSEFGDAHRAAEERREKSGFWGAMGMAVAGAMLFGFGLSSTEEPLMIADRLHW